MASKTKVTPQKEVVDCAGLTACACGTRLVHWVRVAHSMYCLIFGAFQSSTFLVALFGNNGSDVFHYWNLIAILTSEDAVVGDKFVRIGRQIVHSRDVS
jgi:hypothetical protein